MKSARMLPPPAPTPLVTFLFSNQARFFASTAPSALENLSGSEVLPKH
jgi:hypothetical protein